MFYSTGQRHANTGANTLPIRSFRDVNMGTDFVDLSKLLFDVGQCSSFVDQVISEIWNSDWATGSAGRITFSFMNLAPAHWTLEYENNRKQRVLDQFRCGTIKTKDYLYKLGLAADGNCRHCLEHDSFRHFLYDCEGIDFVSTELKKRFPSLGDNTRCMLDDGIVFDLIYAYYTADLKASTLPSSVIKTQTTTNQVLKTVSDVRISATFDGGLESVEDNG